MIPIKTNVRLYLPDILPNTKPVLDKLSTISTTINEGKIYFWMDEEIDSKTLNKFVEEYQSYQHKNLKSIIRSSFFDNQNDFIFFDIQPIKMNKSPQYTRFTYHYNSTDDICKGIDKFKEIYDFIKVDKPYKKQKRNDGEDSNYRE